MAKLPESERPDSRIMRERLQSKVSILYRQMFIEDVQNDCACEIETYDAEGDTDMWYLSAPDKVELNPNVSRMCLPMIPDISDQSILLLLKKVCENAHGLSGSDVIPYVGLVNAKATQEQQDLVRKRIYRSWKQEGIILTDFVPEDTYFLFPEPEFFGALGMNIRGYGAFGIVKTVSRCRYDS